MSDPQAIHRSKERVERDGYLVYAEGDEIPADDVDELRRQGYIDDTPAKKAPAKKPTAPTRKRAKG